MKTLHFLLLPLLTSISLSVQAELMRGMYSYMADAGLFLDCQREQRLPVATEADNAALERAYLKHRYLPGKSLLVEVEGHFEPRQKMEGEGMQENLIVDRFVNIHEQETCAGKVPPSPLKNTYWKLVELEGRHLSDNPLWREGQQQDGSQERELHFIIKADSNLIKGFGGCNYFSGPVSAVSSNISLGPFRSTRKTCPNLKIEQSFIDTINKAEHFKIKGESLELFSQGQSIAKFIAIYF